MSDPFARRSRHALPLQSDEMEVNFDGVAGPSLRMDGKEWDVEALLGFGLNFEEASRVDISTMEHSDIEHIVRYYEEEGVPVVLEGWHRRDGWQRTLFTTGWLENWERASELIKVRNMDDRRDQEMTMTDYLKYVSAVTGIPQSGEQSRLYAKDAVCPHEWEGWMRQNLTSSLLPYGKGDLGSHLPSDLRAETLMNYLGPGDTWTPAHKDLCGSVGQNLMVCSQAGATYWFLTSTKNGRDASAYWRQMGHELDHELHVASVKQLADAPFPVFIVEQRLGDLVVVPSSSCHQVHNAGGLTMKIAWSRMSFRSLEISLREELYIYQRVCRPETYRVKTMVEVVLKATVESYKRSGPQVEHLIALKKLLPLYQQMMIQAYTVTHESLSRRKLDDEHCSACGGDLWQSALVCECPGLREENATENRELLICPACYVDGRSCPCRVMNPVMDKAWPLLTTLGDEVVEILNSMETNDAHKHPRMELILDSESHIPYFRLACFLQASRFAQVSKGLDRTRKCGLQGIGHPTVGETHEFVIDAGVACAPCHRNQCFRHILKRFGRHCATVFKYVERYADIQDDDDVTPSDSTMKSDQWHAKHMASSKKPPIIDFDVLFHDHWEEWLPALATIYQPQTSLHPSILLGWYDDVAHEQQTLEASSETTILVAASSDKSVNDTELTEENEDQDYVVPSSASNRKRKAPLEFTKGQTKSKKKSLSTSQVEEEHLMPRDFPPSHGQDTADQTREAQQDPPPPPRTYGSMPRARITRAQTAMRAPRAPSPPTDEVAEVYAEPSPPSPPRTQDIVSQYPARSIPESTLRLNPSSGFPIEELVQQLIRKQEEDHQTIRRLQQQRDEDRAAIYRLEEELGDKDHFIRERLRGVTKSADEFEVKLLRRVQTIEDDVERHERILRQSSPSRAPPPPPSSYLSSHASQSTYKPGSSSQWHNFDSR